tara:strand:- start:795 stop:1802 length:1008 start_codon:yes stop_codon:yes gene_type:complete
MEKSKTTKTIFGILTIVFVMISLFYILGPTIGHVPFLFGLLYAGSSVVKKFIYLQHHFLFNNLFSFIMLFSPIFALIFGYISYTFDKSDRTNKILFTISIFLAFIFLFSVGNGIYNRVLVLDDWDRGSPDFKPLYVTDIDMYLISDKIIKSFFVENQEDIMSMTEESLRKKIYDYNRNQEEREKRIKLYHNPYFDRIFLFDFLTVDFRSYDEYEDHTWVNLSSYGILRVGEYKDPKNKHYVVNVPVIENDDVWKYEGGKVMIKVKGCSTLSKINRFFTECGIDCSEDCGSRTEFCCGSKIENCCGKSPIDVYIESKNIKYVISREKNIYFIYENK